MKSDKELLLHGILLLLHGRALLQYGRAREMRAAHAQVNGVLVRRQDLAVAICLSAALVLRMNTHHFGLYCHERLCRSARRMPAG